MGFDKSNFNKGHVQEIWSHLQDLVLCEKQKPQYGEHHHNF